MLMLMVVEPWPSQDMVACFSAEQTVSLSALFLCPAQGLENQEVGLLSESSLLEEFQLEPLAVETFPVEVSFSLSFLLASRRAAATSMVCCEPGPGQRARGETCSCYYSSCLARKL